MRLAEVVVRCSARCFEVTAHRLLTVQFVARKGRGKLLVLQLVGHA